MLPSFVIIGTMKGGTTSLYHYIASHPDVVPSAIKETDFFLTDRNFSKGLDWYKSLFKGSGLAYEASPNYTKRDTFPGVPARMYSILPEARLIYVLRDPIDRAISHYIHNYAHGRESRLFKEVIRDFQSNYMLTSKYYYQIQAFLEHYPDKQILLIESEQLRKNTSAALCDIFKFLGLSLEFDTDHLKKKYHESSTKIRRSSLERMLKSRTKNPHFLRGIECLAAPFRKPVEKPNLSTSDRTILIEAILPDTEKLRCFSGLEFSSWSL